MVANTNTDTLTESLECVSVLNVNGRTLNFRCFSEAIVCARVFFFVFSVFYTQKNGLFNTLNNGDEPRRCLCRVFGVFFVFGLLCSFCVTVVAVAAVPPLGVSKHTEPNKHSVKCCLLLDGFGRKCF